MNLQESIDRILANESVALEGFYDRLFQKHPEYRALFEGKSLSAQTAMLTMALVAVKQAPELRPAASLYLRALGVKHKKANVPTEAYQNFVGVLLEQIGEFHGPDWNHALAEQWRDALLRASGLMFQGYETPDVIPKPAT